MVQITESVHPRSLSFANQRKVVILRDQGFFTTDRLRYPLLLVLGPSGKGKTEWAVSLFRNPLKL